MPAPPRVVRTAAIAGPDWLLPGALGRGGGLPRSGPAAAPRPSARTGPGGAARDAAGGVPALAWELPPILPGLTLPARGSFLLAHPRRCPGPGPAASLLLSSPCSRPRSLCSWSRRRPAGSGSPSPGGVPARCCPGRSVSGAVEVRGPVRAAGSAVSRRARGRVFRRRWSGRSGSAAAPRPSAVRPSAPTAAPVLPGPAFVRGRRRLVLAGGLVQFWGSRRGGVAARRVSCLSGSCHTELFRRLLPRPMPAAARSLPWSHREGLDKSRRTGMQWVRYDKRRGPLTFWRRRGPRPSVSDAFTEGDRQ